MSYISQEDYKNLMKRFQKETPKGMLKEAEEMTPKQKKFAALAPPEDKITYADKIVGAKKSTKNEYGYADQPPAGTSPAANYPESWSVRESHPANEQWLDAFMDELGNRQEGDSPEVVQALEKLGPHGLISTYGMFQHPFSVNAFLSDVDEIAADIESSDDEIPRDYDSFSDFNDGEFWEGLNPAPLQATGPTISTVEEDHMDRPFKLPRRTDTSKLDYDPDASRFEPDYMKTPGEDDDDDDDDIISTSDDDDSPELPGGKMFQKMVARDKTRYPFLRENTVANPPYGFEVLSPDERKQLKEYIESVKTIKKEIAKLTAKAGKKVKTEGGDMTGRIMGPSVTSEAASHETIEKIEAKIPEKVYTASVEVIKALRRADLTDAEIMMYLKHEMEEAAKEAVNAQHDLPEGVSSQPEGTERLKVIAANVKKGDIMAGTGEKVTGIWPGARSMGGHLDMNKVTVELEYTKKDGTKGTRAGLWGKNTPVTVFRPSPDMSM